MNGVVIDSMFVYPILLIPDRSVNWVRHFMEMSEKIFMQILRKCLLSYFFLVTKIAFKSSLDLYFHPSIIEFRMGEKIHNKVVVDVSRSAGGRVFLWEIREGVRRNLLSQVKLYQSIWKWNLDQNLIMDLLIMAVCTVLILKA